jgi:hypothetical protein
MMTQKKDITWKIQNKLVRSDDLRQGPCTRPASLLSWT